MSKSAEQAKDLGTLIRDRAGEASERLGLGAAGPDPGVGIGAYRWGGDWRANPRCRLARFSRRRRVRPYPDAGDRRSGPDWPKQPRRRA